MKKTILFNILMCSLIGVHAQFTISGKVIDAETGSYLQGAAIQISGQAESQTLSDPQGNFSFHNLDSGHYVVKVAFFGYHQFVTEFDLNSNWTKVIEMKIQAKSLDPIVFSVERINRNVPTTISSIDKGDIILNGQGRDMPFILNHTPSTVVSSDAGNGIGYTGIRIRGIDPTRVNVTINGVPLNDAESQGVYWVDLPDLASGTQEIQVQRGVGTSTNGAASFGASINLRTDQIQKNPFVYASLGYGSFNSYMASIGLGTGKMKNGFAFQARLRYNNWDGFIDRARTDLYAAQFTGEYLIKKSKFKFNILLGQEETYQAWYGIPQPKFRNDDAELQRYINQLYLNPSELENLNSSDSNTYNYATYKNEVDNYTQNHYQLFYDQQINQYNFLKLTLHATQGFGYYEQQISDDTLGAYGMVDILDSNMNAKTVTLERRLWLSNNFYGTIVNYYHEKGTDQINIGASINQYRGLHYGQVISTEYTPYDHLNHGYYENYALKNDINVYAKYLQNWVHLKPYVDVQFRHVDYAFEGLNRTGDLVEDTVRYNFINPKLGLAYYPTSRLKFYAMYAVGNREPVRDDFVNSSPDSRPKPEHLRDLEMGFDFETYSVNMAFTFYNMRYKDALVLNGQINDVGAYTRVNVAESYRSGIELALAFQLASKLSIAGNYTRSRNKIIDYIEFVDNWETGEQVELFYEGETSMALSPDNIASADLRYHFNSNLFWSIGYKFIDEQYLDNTENEERKLEAFGTLNSSIVWDRYRIKKVHRLTLGFYFNNITNVNYAPTGYSFTGIINNKRESFNYVYPMAGFNFMFKLRLELQKYTEEIIETN